MAKLLNGEYNRGNAVAYAEKWAFGRNPDYYNFDIIGGDCTNFVSQCIYAGTGVMNDTPTYGWFYINVNNRAPAWTSVKSIYNFLTTNKEEGPYGRAVSMEEVQKGDLVQLIINEPDYQHTPIIVSAGEIPSLDTILVAAHSYDCYNRPLSTYNIKNVRFIHIEGFRYRAQ